MDKKIRSHFQRVDPVLFCALEQIALVKQLEIKKSNNYFLGLCQHIISQQLSGKAASTILQRFIALFPTQEVTPHHIFTISEDLVRNAGLSWKKVRFIKNLAQKIVDKELNLKAIEDLNDNEVIVQLTKIKGIGRWTAEMFLMFSLAREDVFSYGDLGLRKAMQKLYKLNKQPNPKQAEKISKKWSPYRTYASRILWKSLEIKS